MKDFHSFPFLLIAFATRNFFFNNKKKKNQINILYKDILIGINGE